MDDIICWLDDFLISRSWDYILVTRNIRSITSFFNHHSYTSFLGSSSIQSRKASLNALIFNELVQYSDGFKYPEPVPNDRGNAGYPRSTCGLEWLKTEDWSKKSKEIDHLKLSEIACMRLDFPSSLELSAVIAIPCLM